MAFGGTRAQRRLPPAGMGIEEGQERLLAALGAQSGHSSGTVGASEPPLAAHEPLCYRGLPYFAPVAQLDRASGFEPAGRVFDSPRARFVGRYLRAPRYSRKGPTVIERAPNVPARSEKGSSASATVSERVPRRAPREKVGPSNGVGAPDHGLSACRPSVPRQRPGDGAPPQP